MYVLDTNVFSLFYVRENPSLHLKRRIIATPFEELYITAITLEEGVTGALKLIRHYNQVKGDEHRKLVSAYDLLQKVMLALSRPQVLPFDSAAYDVYARIPEGVKKIVKVGDCRVAAIAVSQGFTVVTNNIRDYQRIQAVINVRFEDWSSVLPSP